VCGPENKQHGVWGIRTNQELRELHRTPDPAVDINSRRRERLKYGIQTDQIRLKNIYVRQKSRREVGTPSLSWLQNVKK
jgi:hypothetical protein